MARRSGSRAAWAIAVDWGVVVLAAFASERSGSWCIYLVSAVIIARQMNALFELHHHAMHGNVFPARRWSSALEFLYSLPLWTRVTHDRPAHFDHHRTFNTAGRDDLTWGVGYGLDVARANDTRYMLWFLVIRPFVGPLQLADLREVFWSRNWTRREYAVPIATFWGIVVAGFAVLGRLDLLASYWLVPRFTVFPILFFWDDMIGHYNCPRTGTREMRGVWFRLFATHGTNYHNVHHLYPAIPWFNMRRATALAVDDTRVDVGHGIVDSLRQLLRVRQD